MKMALLSALLLFQLGASTEPPVARPEYLRYERAVSVASGTGQACAALDPAIFPHARPSLADLRLFPAQPDATAHEIPYVITVSESATEEIQPARVLNLGAGPGKRVAFDLAMPARPYSAVALDLAAQDFLATATVWGEQTLATPPAERTSLGQFTLFDLSAQHLSHDATLPLVESTFPYLHIELALAPAPGSHTTASQLGPAIVHGAQVPPSRSAQTVYTTVTRTSAITTTGRETTATLEIPAQLPVERVAFVLAPGFHGSFSRDVRVTATPESTPETKQPHSPESQQARPGEPTVLSSVAPEAETLTGTILRVHQTEAGREIRTEQLGIPATLGANLQSPARVQIALQNGDDQPLPIVAVELQMRQRKLCFDAGPATANGLALFYGDPALAAPVYDYERLFRPEAQPIRATLGPEIPNPGYHPRPVQPESFTQRNPEVLWIVLILVICVLGTVALRSARNLGR